MHSPNYDKVKNYYNLELWSIERVKSAIGKWITPEEFTEITGHEVDNE